MKNPRLRTILATGIAAILRGVSDDVATDVVQDLPEQIGARVLDAIPRPQQAAIDVLMEHAEDTAGGQEPTN